MEWSPALAAPYITLNECHWKMVGPKKAGGCLLIKNCVWGVHKVLWLRTRKNKLTCVCSLNFPIFGPPTYLLFIFFFIHIVFENALYENKLLWKMISKCINWNMWAINCRIFKGKVWRKMKLHRLVLHVKDRQSAIFVKAKTDFLTKR